MLYVCEGSKKKCDRFEDSRWESALYVAKRDAAARKTLVEVWRGKKSPDELVARYSPSGQLSGCSCRKRSGR